MNISQSSIRWLDKEKSVEARKKKYILGIQNVTAMHVVSECFYFDN